MESRDPEATPGPDDAPAHYAERTDDDTSPQTGDGARPEDAPPEPGEVEDPDA